MAHTPGPWMLNGWDIVQRDCDDSFPPIAIVGNARRTLTLEEINANARLIAAAPDLIAACHRLMEYWQHGTAVDGGSEAADAVMSAVAKAEGRSVIETT